MSQGVKIKPGDAPTETQERVARYFVSFFATRGTWPALRDVMESFGFSSTNGAKSHLTALVKRGILATDVADKGAARTLYHVGLMKELRPVAERFGAADTHEEER